LNFLSLYLLEKPLKPLTELNLPSAIIACYQRAGISHLFAWQAECLEKASASGELIHSYQFNLFSLINRKKKFYLFCTRFVFFSLKLFSFLNPFVCFLASAGKTIVSELLLIKSVLETKRKALFIEPYVSIVQEKATYFRVSFYSSLHEIHWD
jgi:DNA polymerase theta